MIKIENSRVEGWDAAIRGMRNPKNSWHLSDTEQMPMKFWYFHDDCYYNSDSSEVFNKCVGTSPKVGPKDLTLMKNLANAGNDHGKFLRMITISCDITAPLYWWKEADTYKVGTVADSCSTMHKIQAKEFMLEDFSCEHLYPLSLEALGVTIDALNYYRDCFNTDHNKDDWFQMIQLLPSSYNQKRTVLLNYAVARNMYHSRKDHKLPEWHMLCDYFRSLPYSELITGEK